MHSQCTDSVCKCICPWLGCVSVLFLTLLFLITVQFIIPRDETSAGRTSLMNEEPTISAHVFGPTVTFKGTSWTWACIHSLCPLTCVWPQANQSSLKLDVEEIIIPLVTAHTCVFILHMTPGATEGFALRTAQSHYLFDNESYLSYNKVQPYAPDLNCKRELNVLIENLTKYMLYVDRPWETISFHY